MAVQNGAAVMSVLFPANCLDNDSGLLVGYENSASEDFLLIRTVIPLEEAEEFETVGHERPDHLSLLGAWYSDESEKRNNNLETLVTRLFISKNKEFILLRKNGTGFTPTLYVDARRSKEVDAILIVYANFSGQFLLTDHPLSWGIASGGPKAQGETPNLSNLQQAVLLLNASQDPLKKTEHENSSADFALRSATGVLSVANCVLASAGRCKLFTFRAIQFLVSLPVVFRQLRWRIDQARSLQQYLHSDSNISGASKEEEHSIKDVWSGRSHAPHHSSSAGLARMIAYRNLSSAVMLDVILGILAVACLYSFNCTATMADVLMNITDTVASMLKDLITWLMGVPAGLKLNSELANLLGQFFLYHIFLWKTYLSFMQPCMYCIIWLSILPGCFGVTFLVALVSDVFSLLTLHIYCFYVYAAKIYTLQVKYLLMLARHFTGRRWNAQTSQLEQVPFQINQLFIGTVLFTVLLFLIPTTGLFYCVFTMLRILVLLAKGVLSSVIQCINHLPVYALCKAFFKPGSLAGGLQFELVPPPREQNALCLDSVQLQHCHRVLYLHMKSQPLRMDQLFIWPEHTSEADRSASEQTWSLLTKKILLGQLIYPWINRKN